jgi:hypothetical protein
MRRLLFAVGTLTVIGVSGFVFTIWLNAPRPGITWDNFRLLRFGMKEPQVEALLGCPGKVEGQDGTQQTKSWATKGVYIELYFDRLDPTNEDMTLTQGVACETPDGTEGESEFLHPRDEEDDGFINQLRRLLPW